MDHLPPAVHFTRPLGAVQPPEDATLQQPAVQRRERFRLDYPVGDRPEFHDETGVYPVVDLSETGMCLESTPTGWKGASPGQPAAGRIFFRYSAATDVAGTVVRHDGGTVAISFASLLLPWAIILSEERVLLSRYPLRR